MCGLCETPCHIWFKSIYDVYRLVSIDLRTHREEVNEEKVLFLYPVVSSQIVSIMELFTFLIIYAFVYFCMSSLIGCINIRTNTIKKHFQHFCMLEKEYSFVINCRCFRHRIPKTMSIGEPKCSMLQKCGCTWIKKLNL